MVTKKTKKKKRSSDEPREYDTPRQPLWVKDPKWDNMFQMEGKANDGQRAYLYRERGFVVIANKDWEKDGDLVPGKSIKVTMDALDELLKQYMKQVYAYDFEVEK